MMTSYAADLDDITRAIWAALFETGIERNDDAVVGGEPTVTSIVHIDGAWQGAVILRCSQSLGTTLTTEMLRSESIPTLDDIGDALGELANMVAGNLKALLPAPSSISLPAVVFGSDYELDVPNTTVVADVPFVCDGLAFVVMLLQRADSHGVTA